MPLSESKGFYEEQPDLDRSLPLDLTILASKELEGPIHSMANAIFQQNCLQGDGRFAQLKTTLSMLAANLINAYATDPACFVVISMNSAYYTESRYNCQGIGYTNLRRVVEFLRDHPDPFITYHVGFYDRKRRIGKRTRIQITEFFLNYLFGSKKKPSVADITLNPNFNCIRLKDGKENGKRLIEYQETDIAASMRDRLEQWNQFAARHWADIFITDEQFKRIYATETDGIDDDSEWDEHERPQYVDFTKRRLYRVFNNGSFEQGGRFYGGWWQSIPSEKRKYITIDWRPTHEWDYSNMQPAMLYARSGLSLTDDAYSLPDVDPSYRKLLKKALFQLINARKDQQIRAPSRESLPSDWTWKQLQEALIEKHRPIEQYLHSGIGIELQRLDSDIAESVMHAMMEKGILVLPIHDSFLVQRIHSQAVREQMYCAYKEALQQNIDIEPELSYADKRGPFPLLSSFEDNPILDKLLDPASAMPQGYEQYFERKRRRQHNNGKIGSALSWPVRELLQIN